MNRIKSDPEKYCQFCGKRMHRIRFDSGRLEDLSAFVRRKYCSRECMKKAFVKVGQNEQDIGPAHHSARKIKYLIQGADMVCEKCGSTRNVEVHHKDGNYQNNSPENLMILCRSCHMKEHKPKGKCKICGKVCHISQGMCNKHYLRWKKYGDPLHKPWSQYKEKASKGHVLQFKQDGFLVATYKDIRTAAKETKYARSSIASACNGNRKMLGGYVWKYGL